MRLIVLAVLLLAASSAIVHTTSLLWPKPANFSMDNAAETFTISPCEIKYVVESPGQVFVEELLNLYLVDVFGCTKLEPGKLVMNIVVKSGDQFIATDLKHEKYSISLKDTKKWLLSADYFVGFLRGLETFSQLFERSSTDAWEIKGIPITIEDGPQFLWRGLMIDTSRHFLPISTIKRAIDGMLFSKLNVLHWHITDEDSFPMFVPTVPELSQYGSLNGVYTEVDLKTIIAYGRARGVRVVPEIDTPAHSESWGRSEKYKNITLNCNGKYEGQLDPSLDLTWDVLTKVLNYTNSTFVDDYTHFGGDEVVYDCWGNRQGIIDYMKQHNISSYKALAIDFRQRQKKLWRTLSKKKVIYWANEDIDLPLEDDDVIQWWGVSTNVAKMAGRKNQVILSNYDLTYLDIGFGNYYGRDYSVYQHWRKMYTFNPRVANVNVIGGETCMWNEIGSPYTF